MSLLKAIVTVSNFSRAEIDKYCIQGKREIDVISPASEHIFRFSENIEVLNKYGIKKGEYCYSLSSLSANKNFKWIIEVAKRNKNEIFVISGMKINAFENENFIDCPKNVIITGYVSDDEMVSLIKNCKLFLFPTLYEGFGLTPLEAMALGKNIVVSDIPVMHEIYENSAIYIDPFKYDYTICDFIDKIKNIKDEVTKKYSWNQSAIKLIDLFERCGK